jgi:cell division protein FtsA
VVLSGGTASLRNIRHSASRVMNLPARIAEPENLSGLTDKITNPAYATAIGLLRFGNRVETPGTQGSSGGGSRRPRREGPPVGKIITDFLGRLLPD